MSTNYTQHYQLPIWAPEDSFLREEFNQTNLKIDTALAGAFQPGNLPWVCGNYTGTGTRQEIDLGFAPTAVLLYSADQVQSSMKKLLLFDWGPTAYGTFQYTFTDGSYVPFTVPSIRSGDGLLLEESTDTYRKMLNYAGAAYYYLALR